jgi:hypothetical protein
MTPHPGLVSVDPDFEPYTLPRNLLFKTDGPWKCLARQWITKSDRPTHDKYTDHPPWLSRNGGQKGEKSRQGVSEGGRVRLARGLFE